MRERKRKALAAQAAKSKTIPQMFAAGAGLAGASSTDAAVSTAGPSRESVSEAPITTALMVQEEAEKISVEEVSPPCEGGSDTVVSRYVPSRMVWINIH